MKCVYIHVKCDKRLVDIAWEFLHTHAENRIAHEKERWLRGANHIEYIFINQNGNMFSAGAGELRQLQERNFKEITFFNQD